MGVDVWELKLFKALGMGSLMLLSGGVFRNQDPTFPGPCLGHLLCEACFWM